MEPLESWFEEWYFHHPTELIKHRFRGSEEFGFTCYRQYELPVGRADLVIVHEHGVTVVEIKRERIDENAVAQVLRYIGCLDEIIETRFPKSIAYVDGVVVAPDITDGGRYAVRATGNVKYYRCRPAAITDDPESPSFPDDISTKYTNRLASAAVEMWYELTWEDDKEQSVGDEEQPSLPVLSDGLLERREGGGDDAG